MAPFGLMAASISALTKSFSVLSCTSALARGSSVLSTSFIHPVRCLSSPPTGCPKRPLNSYFRFLLQQKPILSKKEPELGSKAINVMLSQVWKEMSTSEKEPFVEAAKQDLVAFKADYKLFKDQLSPAQRQQRSLERKEKIAKKRISRKKKEMNILGKPKRARTPFIIFIAEHFDEVKESCAVSHHSSAFDQNKTIMKSVVKEWNNLPEHKKQIYKQLAEDDKVRYNHEIKTWESRMWEMGRPDLVRKGTLAAKTRLAMRKDEPRATSEK